MAAECFLYRIYDNVVRSEVYLGGNHTRGDIEQFAAQHGITDATPQESGYAVFPLNRDQLAQFIQTEPTFYVDPDAVLDACRVEYKRPGQLQLVVKS